MRPSPLKRVASKEAFAHSARKLQASGGSSAATPASKSNSTYMHPDPHTTSVASLGTYDSTATPRRAPSEDIEFRMAAPETTPVVPFSPAQTMQGTTLNLAKPYSTPTAPVAGSPKRTTSGRMPRVVSPEKGARSRSQQHRSSGSVPGGDHSFTMASIPQHTTALKEGDIVTLLDTVESRIVLMEDEKQRIKEVQAALGERERAVKSEIEQRFNQLIAALQERKDTVIRAADGVFRPRIGELDARYEFIDHSLRHMKHDCDLTRRSLEQSSDVEVLLGLQEAEVEEDHLRILTGTAPDAIKGLIQRLRDLRENGVDSAPPGLGVMENGEKMDAPMHFVHTHPELATAISDYGKISLETTLASKCTVKGPGLETLEQEVPAGLLLVARDHSGEQRAQGGDSIAVVFEKADTNFITHHIHGTAHHPSHAIDATAHVTGTERTMPNHGFFDITIKDNRDGTYLIRFTPMLAGEYFIDIRVNDDPVQGSPFHARVQETTFIAPTFSGDPPKGLRVEAKRCIVTKKIGEWRSITSATALSMKHPSWWKVRIHELGAVWLGITANPNQEDESYKDSTAFGWYSNNFVFSGGQYSEGACGWEGFEQGDEVIFKFDPLERRLHMHVRRLPLQAFWIDLSAHRKLFSNHGRNEGLFYILCSLNLEDKVELAHVTLPTDPGRTKATGIGLKNAFSDVRTGFLVQTYNEAGVPQARSVDDNITLDFEHLDSGSGVDFDAFDTFESEVQDGKDGTYCCTYTAARSGKFHMHVYLNGLPIHGSPFLLTVHHAAQAPLRFVHPPTEPHLDAALSLKAESPGLHVTRHVLPKNRVSWWKLRLASFRPHGAAFFGVASASAVARYQKEELTSSVVDWGDRTAVGWCAKPGAVIKQGRECFQSIVNAGNWRGFQSGDVLSFSFDPKHRKLRVYVKRKPLIHFTLDMDGLEDDMVAVVGLDEGDFVEIVDRGDAGDPQQVVVKGPGVRHCNVDVLTGFYINVRTVEGLLQPAGGELVQVKVTRINNTTFGHQQAAQAAAQPQQKKLKGSGGRRYSQSVVPQARKDNTCECDLKDEYNGQYLFTYTPLVDGDLTIDVTLAGEHVRGSPFSVKSARSEFLPVRLVAFEGTPPVMIRERGKLALGKSLLMEGESEEEEDDESASDEDEDEVEEQKKIETAEEEKKRQTLRRGHPRSPNQERIEDITWANETSSAVSAQTLPLDRPVWWKAKVSSLKCGCIGVIRRPGSGSTPAKAGPINDDKKHVWPWGGAPQGAWRGIDGDDELTFCLNGCKLSVTSSKDPLSTFTMHSVVPKDPATRDGCQLQVYIELGAGESVQTVDPKPVTAASHCVLEGPGLSEALDGIKTGFYIEARTVHGFPQPVGGDKVEVSFTHGSRALRSGAPLEPHPQVQVTDFHNGFYLCTYDIADQGAYAMEVRINGEAVRKEPFAVEVRHAPFLSLRFKSVLAPDVLALAEAARHVVVEPIADFSLGPGTPPPSASATTRTTTATSSKPKLLPCVAQHHLPSKRKSFWALKLHQVKGELAIGVMAIDRNDVGDFEVTDSLSARHRSFYGWGIRGGKAYTIRGGREAPVDNQAPAAGMASGVDSTSILPTVFNGFRTGDDVVMCYDPDARRVDLRLRRKPVNVFSCVLGSSTDSIAVGLHAVVFVDGTATGDRVELVDVNAENYGDQAVDGRVCGHGTAKALVQTVAAFQIQAVDSDGFMRPVGGDDIEVSMEPAAEAMRGVRDAYLDSLEVQDNGDGSYNCLYVPTMPGEYKLHVVVNGYKVSQSPFRVAVVDPGFVQLRFTQVQGLSLANAGLNVATHNTREPLSSEARPRGGATTPSSASQLRASSGRGMPSSRSALAAHELPMARASTWRFKVSRIRDSMFVGVRIMSYPREQGLFWQDRAVYGFLVPPSATGRMSAGMSNPSPIIGGELQPMTLEGDALRPHDWHEDLEPEAGATAATAPNLKRNRRENVLVSQTHSKKLRETVSSMDSFILVLSHDPKSKTLTMRDSRTPLRQWAIPIDVASHRMGSGTGAADAARCMACLACPGKTTCSVSILNPVLEVAAMDIAGPGIGPEVLQGVPTWFTMTARDKNGNRIAFGGEKVRAMLRLVAGGRKSSDHGDSGVVVNGRVEDLEDGSYRCTYIPGAAGQYNLSIMVNQAVLPMQRHVQFSVASVPFKPIRFRVSPESNIGGASSRSSGSDDRMVVKEDGRVASVPICGESGVHADCGMPFDLLHKAWWKLQVTSTGRLWVGIRDSGTPQDFARESWRHETFFGWALHTLHPVVSGHEHSPQHEAFAGTTRILPEVRDGDWLVFSLDPKTATLSMHVESIPMLEFTVAVPMEMIRRDRVPFRPHVSIGSDGVGLEASPERELSVSASLQHADAVVQTRVFKDDLFEFVVEGRDANGNLQLYGGEAVDLDIRPVSKSSDSSREASIERGARVSEEDAFVQDTHTGTYHCKFTPSTVGEFVINVTMNGVQVSGCPFNVIVGPSANIPVLADMQLSSPGLSFDPETGRIAHAAPRPPYPSATALSSRLGKMLHFATRTRIPVERVSRITFTFDSVLHGYLGIVKAKDLGRLPRSVSSSLSPSSSLQQNPWELESAHMWASNPGKLVSRGKLLVSGATSEAWPGIVPGDRVTVTFDPAERCLSLTLGSAPQQTHSLPVIPGPRGGAGAAANDAEVAGGEGLDGFVFVVCADKQTEVIADVSHCKSEIDGFSCVVRGEGMSMCRAEEVQHFTLLAHNADGFPIPEGGADVKIQLIPEEAGSSGDDNSGGLDYTVDVVDNDDGSYACEYTLEDNVAVKLAVAVNGVALAGSPFSLKALPPLLRFLKLSEDGIRVLENSKDRTVVSSSEVDHRYAVAWPPLRDDRPTYWKLNLHEFGGGYLGIIGNEHPANDAFDDPSAYAWQGGSFAVIGGKRLSKLDGWAGFKPRDVAVFRFEPQAQRLTLQLHRQGEAVKTHALAIRSKPTQQYWVMVNPSCFRPFRVELEPADRSAWNTVAEAAHKTAKMKRTALVFSAGTSPAKQSGVAAVAVGAGTSEVRPQGAEESKSQVGSSTDERDTGKPNPTASASESPSAGSGKTEVRSNVATASATQGAGASSTELVAETTNSNRSDSVANDQDPEKVKEDVTTAAGDTNIVRGTPGDDRNGKESEKY